MTFILTGIALLAIIGFFWFLSSRKKALPPKAAADLHLPSESEAPPPAPVEEVSQTSTAQVEVEEKKGQSNLFHQVAEPLSQASQVSPRSSQPEPMQGISQSAAPSPESEIPSFSVSAPLETPSETRRDEAQKVPSPSLSTHSPSGTSESLSGKTPSPHLEASLGLRAESKAEVHPLPDERPVAKPSEVPAQRALKKAYLDPAQRAEEKAALKKGLSETRSSWVSRLVQLFNRKSKLDPSLANQIEEILLAADIGPRTVELLMGELRERLKAGNFSDQKEVWSYLRNQALSMLGETPGPVTIAQVPTVVIVVGVNGVGKTTTIGKIASCFTRDGKKVFLVAGDTFRAAATVQLEMWASRTNSLIIKGKERSDPSALVFDGIKRAIAEGGDLVLVDTAGRLHTKSNLMEELKKIVRTAEKALGRPPDEVLLVLDATTGQNALSQAEMFTQAVPITG
ncbi:MAG: AAA family ATPase, partial [Sandaracinaceae bacterium]|nr:AAA family ATPase [Sandaracinaceae bacterium]